VQLQVDLSAGSGNFPVAAKVDPLERGGAWPEAGQVLRERLILSLKEQKTALDPNTLRHLPNR